VGYLLLYMTLAYAGMGLLALALWKAMKPRTSPQRWGAWYGTAFLAAVPILPYLAVEARTAAHYRSLAPAVRQALRQDGGPDQFLYFRVLSSTAREARVLVVAECAPGSAARGKRMGLALEFRRQKRGWTWSGGGDTVWSDCGDASGNVFPPFPEGL
jgi:hypothetical protein